MSTYGNAASIFQLAFGLNAALPAVYFAYRRAHDSLATHLAEEMSRIDPTLKFGERELIVVRQYVRYSFPAMRNSRPLGLVIAGLFSVAVVLSLIGLVLSAVDSSAPLEAWFKTGLFWVTQTIGILLPGEGGLDAEMKKTGRVSNRFRVRLKGVETL